MRAGPAGRPGRGRCAPATSSARTAAAAAVELEQVLDDALPLLQAIQPDKLAATLGALATALDGRGDQLGQDLVAAGRLPGRAQPAACPPSRADITRLADVLRHLRRRRCPTCWPSCATSRSPPTTVADQRDQLAAFLADTTDLADVDRGLPATATATRSSSSARSAAPVLELLAAYAPEYPCLLQGLVGAAAPGRAGLRRRPDAHHARGHQGQRQVRHRPATSPVYGARTGPDCRGLPTRGARSGRCRSTTATTTAAAARSPGRCRPAATPACDGLRRHREEQGLRRSRSWPRRPGPRRRRCPTGRLLWGPLLRGAVVNAS